MEQNEKHRKDKKHTGLTKDKLPEVWVSKYCLTGNNTITIAMLLSIKNSGGELNACQDK